MDHTIEVWTDAGERHWASCTCGWILHHAFQHMLEIHVKNHIQTHNELGHTVEVI